MSSGGEQFEPNGKAIPTAPVYDIAILGCGAAGLMAAIQAGHAAREIERKSQGTARRQRIVAVDGAKKLGAKILVAGGGRCNVTHHAVAPEDYAGGSKNTIRKVLTSWPVEETVAWFDEHGVRLKREDTGKLFPTTDKARTVLDALLKAAREVGVELRHPWRAESVRWIGPTDRDGNAGENTESGESHGNVTTPARFEITGPEGQILCRRLIVATGGLALPRSGSDGAGYGFVKGMGHTVTPTTPALVPLKLAEGSWLLKHSGVVLNSTLGLWSAKKKRLVTERGPMLLTHFGLSGPAPMNLSRHWLNHRHKNSRTVDPGVTVTAALIDEPFEGVDQRLIDAAKAEPKLSVVRWLQREAGLPQKLAESFAKHEGGILPGTSPGMSPSQGSSPMPLAQLDRERRRKLARALTALPLPVVGDRGYTHAEVTAGGIPLNEVDPVTMASRACAGLFLCGEILDCDGRIGGFNFQWAWCTGRLAGRAAAAS